MATIGGPNTEKDGLVFGYDTGYGVNNTATNSRYYQGKPTSNLSNDMTKYFNNWSGMTGSTSYYTTDRGNQGIHLITTNSGGVQFYASSTINNISANTQYTVSATIKYSGTTPHVNMFYIRQYHNGSQITEGGKFSTSFMIDLGGGWYRAYRTFTTTPTTSYINLQGYQYSNGVNLKIQDLQFEIGNQLSPYIGSLGTRTSTESLIDLKRTTDIDVSNVSFDSTGQPTFDGTDDYIDVTSMSSFNLHNITILAKPFETITPSYLGYYPQWMEQSGFYIAQGPWTGAATNETFHIWNSNGTMTHIRDNISNDWHQFVWNWNGTTYDCYIDGIQKTTYPRSNGHANLITTTTNTLRLGANFSTYFYKGDMSVIKMYDRALSADEIQQNFNAYKNRFDI